MTKKPQKLTYRVNDEFNPYGMEITVYEKGEEKTFTAGFGAKVTEDSGSSNHTSDKSSRSSSDDRGNTGTSKKVAAREWKDYKETTGAWKRDETGWTFVNGTTAYRDTWIFTGQNWYYMSQNSYMETGWKLLDGKWFYLNPESGSMKISWIYLNGRWYWLDEISGEMAAEKWGEISGNWYYFNLDGSMAVSTKTPDGYTVGADGAWIK